MSSSYAAGSFSLDDFREVFGMKPVSESEAYSEGSTTGTKQLGSGDTYLTEQDYDKHKNSDQTWDAYAEIYGQEAMESKREGNQEGLSINAFDSLMDKLYDGEEKEETTEAGKTFNDYEFSPQVQEAMDRAQTYRENAWSGQHAQDVYGKSNELAKQSKFYQEPGDETNNGAQAASDSATAKHFDAGKYKTDYSENEFKHFKTQY